MSSSSPIMLSFGKLETVKEAEMSTSVERGGGRERLEERRNGLRALDCLVQPTVWYTNSATVWHSLVTSVSVSVPLL